MNILPENILRRMSAKDRAEYAESVGPAAAMTAAEATAAAQAGEERQLQEQIAQWLNLKDVAFINPRMDKRSPLPGGWPDFTLAYQGIPIAIECKTVAGALRPEQQQCLAKMEQNGWTILIARDLAAVARLFQAIERGELQTPRDSHQTSAATVRAVSLILQEEISAQSGKAKSNQSPTHKHAAQVLQRVHSVVNNLRLTETRDGDGNAKLCERGEGT